MNEHQQKIIEELNSLVNKLVDLDAAIMSYAFTTLSSNERFLMQHQSHLMKLYAEVLRERIFLFK